MKINSHWNKGLLLLVLGFLTGPEASAGKNTRFVECPETEVDPSTGIRMWSDILKMPKSVTEKLETIGDAKTVPEVRFKIPGNWKSEREVGDIEGTDPDRILRPNEQICAFIPIQGKDIQSDSVDWCTRIEAWFNSKGRPDAFKELSASELKGASIKIRETLHKPGSSKLGKIKWQTYSKLYSGEEHCDLKGGLYAGSGQGQVIIIYESVLTPGDSEVLKLQRAAARQLVDVLGSLSTKEK